MFKFDLPLYVETETQKDFHLNHSEKNQLKLDFKSNTSHSSFKWNLRKNDIIYSHIYSNSTQIVTRINLMTRRHDESIKRKFCLHHKVTQKYFTFFLINFGCVGLESVLFKEKLVIHHLYIYQQLLKDGWPQEWDFLWTFFCYAAKHVIKDVLHSCLRRRCGSRNIMKDECSKNKYVHYNVYIKTRG